VNSEGREEGRTCLAKKGQSAVRLSVKTKFVAPPPESKGGKEHGRE